jgi:hypothetical protein
VPARRTRAVWNKTLVAVFVVGFENTNKTLVVVVFAVFFGNTPEIIQSIPEIV